MWRPPKISTPSIVASESSHSASRSGPLFNVSEAELLDQVSELPGSSPVLQQTRNNPPPRADNPAPGLTHESMSVPGAAADTTLREDESRPFTGARTTFQGNPEVSAGMGAHFRGNPVDFNPDPSNSNMRGRDYASYDSRLGGNAALSRRTRLFDPTFGRTPLVRSTPTRSHPYIDEVTFGAETFEDYTPQLQFSEVKYKDF